MKWLLTTCALLFGMAAGYWLADGGGEVATFESPERPKSEEALAPKSEEAPALPQSEAAAVSRSEISEEWLESLESKEQIDQLAALIPRIKEASPGDFAALMEALEKYGGSGSLKHMSRNLLATRWAETDPQGMLSYIKEQPREMQWRLNSIFFGAWARENPEAAFAAAESTEDRRARSGAMQSVINAIAATQPRRAVEMAQSMEAEAGHNYSWVLRNVFQTWANSEPEAARQAALALPEGESKVRALSGALGEWMADDPVAALNWLDSLPEDWSIYNSRKEVFRQFLNNDFDTAKQFIEQRSDPYERREALSSMYFGNFASKMEFEEIEEVYGWLDEVSSGQTYDRKVSDLVQAMAGSDPNRAIDFAMNLPPGNARMDSLRQLGSHLAREDPAAAIAFAESMVYEDEKDRVLQNMGWQLSRYGAEKVAKLIGASTDPKVQEQLARRITGEWSQYDREGALAWAEALENESVRRDALRPVFDNWLQADPRQALDYLQRSVEEGQQRNYLTNAFGQWAREDPETAVSWLDRLPESFDDQRSTIYGQVANYYVRHDPMAASEWIASLDQGPERDRSVETLVNNISRTDPEAGFLWAATVSDTERRKNTLTNSVRAWVKTDPDAAYDAVRDANIEAEEKESLFEMIDRDRND